jgi:hypothetical protein
MYRGVHGKNGDPRHFAGRHRWFLPEEDISGDDCAHQQSRQQDAQSDSSHARGRVNLSDVRPRAVDLGKI